MNTPNRPRSGMVPPLVTASRCAPGRPGDRAGHAIPDDPRPQLGELVARIPARSAGRASPRTPSAAGSRRAPSGARSPTSPRPRGCRGRPPRRSAAPGCRAGWSARPAPRSARSASARSPPSCAAGRRGASGTARPCEISPTWCPARPTRCSPLATLGGDSTWITRSTAPMSMPSSSELVATTQRRRPLLRSSSMIARCSLRHAAVVRAGQQRDLGWPVRHQLRRPR